MKLADLQTGDYGIITKVLGIGAFRKRIMEMGFIRGKKVLVVKNAPLRDPIEYNIMGYEVSLRRSEASLIEVITIEEARQADVIATEGLFRGVFTEEKLRKTALVRGKTINVAMIGNPNAGKTSLFNHASNSKEHVGNFAGVTVDSKTATVQYKGYTLNITDLPGTYSLTTYSPEELYVRDFIANNHPDVVINVVDASNLERNLYLTTQLIDMDIKVVMALNMFDELEKRDHHFNYQSLGQMIGIPIIPTVGSKGKGIKELFEMVIAMYSDKDNVRRHVHINYGEDVERSILKLRSLIKAEINQDVTLHFSSRFLAVKLLEKDKAVHAVLQNCANYEEIKQRAEREYKRLETSFIEDCETIITDAKYGFIDGALKETYLGEFKSEKQRSVIIDQLLTNRYLGFPVFLLFLWIMFQSTFTLGSYPMDWIDAGVHYFSNYLQQGLPDGSLKDLLIDGVIGGVGGVLVFLPNILILFFFISIMEDTGYMARAAFIMDKIMHKVGLHGKSFIPLIMGFGCNVPAVMSTRIIENATSRKVTMLINPFFSCSARLPVYVLIISVFAPKNPGLILFLLYIAGIVIAALMAYLFRKFLFRKNEVPFVMELPPYRIPNPRTTFRHTWHKGQQYLKKMGGVILTASVIIWALGYFPRNAQAKTFYTAQTQQITKSVNQQLAITHDSMAIDSLKKAAAHSIQLIAEKEENERQYNSYAARIGRFFEPIMQPLGFDWRMSMALLSGVAAKEIIISTMGVLYQANDASEDNERLIKRLQSSVYQEGPNIGQPIFTPVTSLSFLVFILVYFPCIAVIAAIGKESGSWKLALFEIAYTSVLAWFLSFAVYQIGRLLGM